MQDLAIKKIHFRKLVLFLLSLVCFFAFLLLVKNMLVSFLLGFVGFYILNPWVDHLERKGFSRLWSVTIPFLLVSFLFFGLLQTFLPTLSGQFESLKAEFPKYTAGVQHLLVEAKTTLLKYLDEESSTNVILQVQSHVESTAKNIFSDLPNHISNSLTVLFLAPFLMFFMLLDGREWVRKMLSLVPNSYFELALNLNYQISTQMGGFVRARMIQSMIITLILWLGLVILNFPYALVLALFGGLLNLIPYFGPVIGAVPAFLVGFINGAPSADFTGLLIIYIGAQVIDSALIVPFLVAKIVNLHPVTVVLAIIVGSQTMGILGMIISIPVASALKVSAQSIYAHVTDFRK